MPESPINSPTNCCANCGFLVKWLPVERETVGVALQERRSGFGLTHAGRASSQSEAFHACYLGAYDLREEVNSAAASQQQDNTGDRAVLASRAVIHADRCQCKQFHVWLEWLSARDHWDLSRAEAVHRNNLTVQLASIIVSGAIGLASIALAWTAIVRDPSSDHVAVVSFPTPTSQPSATASLP